MLPLLVDTSLPIIMIVYQGGIFKGFTLAHCQRYSLILN